MQYIEWENGVRRMRHRKLIQGLSLHAFYPERTEMVLRAKGGCETLHDIQTRILLKDYAKVIQMEEKF